MIQLSSLTFHFINGSEIRFKADKKYLTGHLHVGLFHPGNQGVEASLCMLDLLDTIAKSLSDYILPFFLKKETSGYIE